ncbi:barstar [Bacteriovorax sp. BSW11_IV]|uniref:barstar family protein n=1 Tax=Bacteriovorax sp. BSW11_IV TaxID=1353529 RepID=UPI000389E2D0|nr:barstar family protein [Bacteriovorax sp. BSW11_IV]EQC49233.1 barstar [Bacteriovorax sp. BSW11_IV]
MKREVEIMGSILYSLDDFHREVEQLLSFPHYYDRSMDALWECLTHYIDPNIRINWINHEMSRKQMGNDFERVVSLLQSAAADIYEFEFVLN